MQPPAPSRNTLRFLLGRIPLLNWRVCSPGCGWAQDPRSACKCRATLCPEFSMTPLYTSSCNSVSYPQLQINYFFFYYYYSSFLKLARGFQFLRLKNIDRRRPDSTLACKELSNCHSILTTIKNPDKLKSQQLFLDLSEQWGHRANHYPPKWSYKQVDTENYNLLH